MRIRAGHAWLLAFALCAACGGQEDGTTPQSSSASAPATDGTAVEAQPGVPDPNAPALRSIDLGGALTVDILREGQGRGARPGSELLVQYEGRTESAETPFVTTKGLLQPARWVLDPQHPAHPIEGLARAVIGLPPGTQARVHVPGYMAYGERGAPSASIEPNADLIFTLELVEVR